MSTRRRITVAEIGLIARRATGRSGTFDERIPSAAIVADLLGRSTELARGLLRLRTRTFLGRGVRLRGRRGLSIGRYVRIGAGCTIDALGVDGVDLGDASRLGDGCVITTTSHSARLGVGFRLGSRSGLGDYCHVGASGGVTVGDDVIGGPFVSFHSQDHVFASRYVPIREQGTTEKGIHIGDNCWIGAKATFLDGTKLAAGSVVAAGAVVMGEFDRPAILGGVPARVIRYLDE